MEKANYILIGIFLAMLVLICACSNNGNNSTKNPEGQDSVNQVKGVSIKERQAFHISAQKEIDSLQHKINQMDKEMKRKMKLQEKVGLVRGTASGTSFTMPTGF